MTNFLQQTFNGLSVSAAYVLVGVGLTVVFGVSRVMNYAQGQLAALGAFIGYALVAGGVPWWAALILAPVAVAVVGEAMYLGALRRVSNDAPATFIVAVGLGIIVEQLIVAIWSAKQRQITPPFPGTVNLGGVVLADSRLLMLGVCIPTVIVLIWALGHTSLGRQMRATSENSSMASLTGINTMTVRSAAFMLGSALAGVAGVLLGILFPFTPFTGNGLLIKGLAVALAGGIGNVTGAIVVGVALGMVETYASGYGINLGAFTIGPEWRDGWAFLLLVGILAFRPQGLFRGAGAV
jgi:branched-subunit amino acid ABC-type transport system permease component